MMWDSFLLLVFKSHAYPVPVSLIRISYLTVFNYNLIVNRCSTLLLLPGFKPHVSSSGFFSNFALGTQLAVFVIT